MIICAIGSAEIILICAVILLVFGGKKLPELMKGVGKGVRNFKEGMREPSEEEINMKVEEEIRKRVEAKLTGTDTKDSDIKT